VAAYNNKVNRQDQAAGLSQAPVIVLLLDLFRVRSKTWVNPPSTVNFLHTAQGSRKVYKGWFRCDNRLHHMRASLMMSWTVVPRWSTDNWPRHSTGNTVKMPQRWWNFHRRNKGIPRLIRCWVLMASWFFVESWFTDKNNNWKARPLNWKPTKYSAVVEASNTFGWMMQIAGIPPVLPGDR